MKTASPRVPLYSHNGAFLDHISLKRALREEEAGRLRVVRHRKGHINRAIQLRHANLVRVVSQGDCHLAFGSNPTAMADGTCVFLPAGMPEYFVIASGSKIAVIQDSTAATGNLFITAAQ